MYYSTKPSVMPYLVALALTVGRYQLVLAANDWKIPCVQGQCSWDLPNDSHASGTLQIWGSNTSISDLTSAAGWNITHCDPAATNQDIQLMCPDANSDCDHLFQGGAVDTIVRLPDDCGPMPFARVANHWTNQSNSRSVNARASDAKFHYLTLDTNFSAVTPSSNGNVYFTVQGLNGKTGESSPSAVNQRRWITRRNFHRSPRHVHRRDLFSNLLTAVENATVFNKTVSENWPFNFSGKENLFNTSISCPSTSTSSSFTASVSLDVDGSVQADINVGAVVAGMIIPPEITELGLTLGLDGNIGAQFSLSANVTGPVSSGTITLFQVGIPGLSFPGIIELGPEFIVTGEVDADFALSNLDAAVSIAYNFSEVATTFPQSGSTSGSFIHGTSEVTVSASPDVTDAGASVSVTGHLIPQIDIGLSAFGGIVSSSVFLNLDASLDLSVTADNNDDAQACVDASTELAVNIGAQAAFFDLFKASTNDTLFDKNFPLLQKCVGLPESRRNYALRDADAPDMPSSGGPHARSQNLACPSAVPAQSTQLLSAVIPAR